MSNDSGMTDALPASLQSREYSGERARARDIFVLTSVMVWGAFLLPPPSSAGQILNLPSPCVFYHLTGLPCPACGLTRAFVCTAHGQWAQAAVWHPLGTVLFFAAVYYWCDSLSVLRRGRRLVSGFDRQQRTIGVVGLTVTILFGIARMAYLAVHHIAY